MTVRFENCNTTSSRSSCFLFRTPVSVALFARRPDHCDACLKTNGHCPSRSNKEPIRLDRDYRLISSDTRLVDINESRCAQRTTPTAFQRPVRVFAHSIINSRCDETHRPSPEESSHFLWRRCVTVKRPWTPARGNVREPWAGFTRQAKRAKRIGGLGSR